MSARDRLTIAMIGQRGLPATFGGVEHHVEEIAARLVRRGHRVIAFTRPRYEGTARSYRGIELVPIPTLHTKHLDAIAHSAASTIAAMARRVDVVHYHAVGPGIPAALPRYLSGARVVLTVHGLDGERQKWGPGARAVLRGAEWLSARVPHETIVVSRDLRRHFLERYGRATWYIPNGVARPSPVEANGTMQRLGLRSQKYVLFVGRLVPEKAPDMLIRAFRRLDTDARLVLAGGSSFTDDYLPVVRRAASGEDRVVMPGYVYGRDLGELYANASAFVLPSLLEGLPLTLLEAASYGIPVVASDIPPNVEVIGSEGPGRRLFRAGSESALADALRAALADPDGERAGASRLREDVLGRYSWDEAAAATEAVYEAATGGETTRG
jgi:glycosyltransferase involved in cell wall biosynthesis